MTRTDNDTWDLASSVGATATMVAAARAAATRRPDRVIDDPFAGPLVRAVGVDFFTRLADGELDFAETGAAEISGWMIDVFAVRARYYDDFFASVCGAGIRQVVIVASGLDSRAYRLQWPAGTTVYEIDQPEVIEFKTITMAKIGARPTADLHTVGIDLRQDWPMELQRAGFDPTQPTAWNAEGLLIGWLPGDAQDRLLDNITALSAPGSRLTADHLSRPSEWMQSQMQAMTEHWREQGLDVDLSDLTFAGECHNVETYLQSHGWDTTGRTLDDLFAEFAPHLHLSDGAPLAIEYVSATREV